MVGTDQSGESMLLNKRQGRHLSMWKPCRDQAARLSFEIRRDKDRLARANPADPARIMRIKDRMKGKVKALRGLYLQMMGMIIVEIVAYPLMLIIDLWNRRPQTGHQRQKHVV